jgi:signal transduction histidine kinase
VYQDISALRALDRQKDAFLASVSHDLKNPLMAIRGQAQLMRRRIDRGGTLDPQRLAAGLREVEAGTDRLTAMLNELLDVARLQMGRPLDLERGPVDLVALARRVAEEYQRSTAEHRLCVQASSEEIVGHWDSARLRRVLENLLSNAIKYSPGGGEVTIGVARSARDGSEWAELTVRDLGLGIPAEDLPRVFERFHRGSNVRGTVAGTGLGLAGAHQIVEQHGGTIAVESREGEGTIVTVRLPLSAQ